MVTLFAAFSLSEITIKCFFASYVVVLLLELSRLRFRLPARHLVTMMMAGAGLFAHTAFLWHRAHLELKTGLPLSSPSDWYLVAAWLAILACLVRAITNPDSSVGLFLVPTAISLVGITYGFPSEVPVERSVALQVWGGLHGIFLLLGTATVSIGFVAGLIYLVQSNRLKKKLPVRSNFRLPSLEWLQKANIRSLQYSTCLMAVGMLAGIVLNLVKQVDPVPWTDSVVLSSGLLVIWLLVVSVFELLYKPAQQGRKVAYLTVASFIFLALVVAMLVSGQSQHARPRKESNAALPASSDLSIGAQA